MMLNNAYKKRHSAIKQADIRDMFAKTSKKVKPTQMDITKEITIEDDNSRLSTQREPLWSSKTFRVQTGRLPSWTYSKADVYRGSTVYELAPILIGLKSYLLRILAFYVTDSMSNEFPILHGED